MASQQRFSSTLIRGLLLKSVLVLAMYGCSDPTTPEPNIEPTEILLMDVKITPWVTKPGEPFTLEVIVRGDVGSEIHFYPSPGATIGPDGSLTPNIPTGLTQNGTERDYLVLRRDETYDENQVYLESRFTANDIVLPIEEYGVAVATIWDIRIQDPANIPGANFFRVLLSFRSADPAVIGEPEITQLDTDTFTTSRVVNIISDGADEVSRNAISQITQRYYDFFPDDRDFLVVQKPPNVDTSAGGYFYLSGQRERGLGDEAERNPAFFGSSGRLKGAIQSLRGIYSLSATMEEDFCLLTHELLHRWAAHMGEPLAPDGSHWDDDPLTGLDRDQSGFGLDRICALNDFELYLAGLIPADSVSTPLNQNGYTVDNFINDNGQRDPAYPDTQRDFTIGFIVESEERLTDHELAFFHHIAREISSHSSPHSRTWLEATGGRSSLDSELPSFLMNLP